jgi:hypothetical protein
VITSATWALPKFETVDQLLRGRAITMRGAGRQVGALETISIGGCRRPEVNHHRMEWRVHPGRIVGLFT